MRRIKKGAIVEILGIIPARGGSKGIKRKNLKEILGKPLVAYSIEAGLNSKLITKVVVSTEDSEIKEISLKYGAEVIDRPIELAKDETKTAPVMKHVLNELEKDGYKPNYVVLLQPTSPQRNSEFLDKALEFFFENKEYDSCFSGYLFNISHSKWIKSKNGKIKKARFSGLLKYKNTTLLSYQICYLILYSRMCYLSILSRILL